MKGSLRDQGGDPVRGPPSPPRQAESEAPGADPLPSASPSGVPTPVEVETHPTGRRAEPAR